MTDSIKLLAFDTSTQTLGAALYINGQAAFVTEEGGAKASERLLPIIDDLLKAHHLTLNDLNAIAFGSGPGAFTGLRTATAAAQGLAMGSGLPLIPIITLLAGAQEQLMEQAQTVDSHGTFDILVQLDARMDEWYWAHYRWTQGAERWQTVAAPSLSTLDVIEHYAQQNQPALRTTIAEPQLKGMLALAQQAFKQGETVSAEEALPLYIRNKVAQTTAERMADKAAK